VIRVTDDGHITFGRPTTLGSWRFSVLAETGVNGLLTTSDSTAIEGITTGNYNAAIQGTANVVGGYAVYGVTNGTGGAIGVFGQAVTGTGVRGESTDSTGLGMLATSGGVGARAFVAEQTGNLSNTNSNRVAFINRNATLGGFDLTGALLEISDSTASSGDLIRIDKLSTLSWGIKSTGTVYMPGSQVGNAGLVSGDTYFDTAANILANGDKILARKV
jgi:hypothetical protein